MKRTNFLLSIIVLTLIVLPVFTSCVPDGYYSEQELEIAYNNGYENGKEAGYDLCCSRDQSELESMSPCDFVDMCEHYTGEHLMDSEELAEYAGEICRISFVLGYAASDLGIEQYYGIRHIDYYPEIEKYLDDYSIPELEDYILSH